MPKSKRNNEENKKTDIEYPFLQSLSHEIRTPMNAITGLSELLMQKSVDPETKEYLMSLQAATRHLLMVTNNIIDYDEISRGNFELHAENVDFAEMIGGVVDMARLMIGERSVIFIADINPLIPMYLKLDPTRVTEVLVYYLSNAAKNTDRGYIALCADLLKKEQKIRFTVENTEGSFGITEGLLSKLGTKAESVVNEEGGTNIYFDISFEEVRDREFEMPKKLPGSYALCLKNKRELEAVSGSFARMKINHRVINNPTDFFMYKPVERPDTLITEYERAKKLASVKEFTDLGIKLVGIINPGDEADEGDVTVIRRPVFYPDLYRALTEEEKSPDKEGLILEGVRILVVDDNAINLKVTAGLMEPYGASIETATGGEEAIRMIHRTRYDLVFMDHMMPGMDGVQAVKIIREADDEYFKTLPVIALTANVLEESRRLFKECGMNDFLAKPVVSRELEEMLKKWVPKSKQKTGARKPEGTSGLPDFTGLSIKHINPETGLSYTNGNGRMYMSILEDFYKSAPERGILLTKLIDDEDIGRYTIEVHSLKSIARTIGAGELSSLCEELERHGHQRNFEGIVSGHDGMLEELSAVTRELERIVGDQKPETEKQPLSREKAGELLRDMYHAMKDFDYDTAEKGISELEKYELDDISAECFEALKGCVSNIDYEGTSRQAVRMLALL